MLAASSAVTFRDLFLWNVLIGQDDFMHEFWRRSESPLRAALLGARLARVMTERMQFGKAKCFNQQTCSSHGRSARCQRSLRWPGRRPSSAARLQVGRDLLLDMAMQFEMKSFLAQKQCQALMDSWWAGGSRGSTAACDYSVLALASYSLFAPQPLPLDVKAERDSDTDLIRSMDGVAGLL